MSKLNSKTGNDNILHCLQSVDYELVCILVNSHYIISSVAFFNNALVLSNDLTLTERKLILFLFNIVNTFVPAYSILVKNDRCSYRK